MAAFGIDFGTTNSVLASVSGGDVSTAALDEPPQEWAELGFDKVLPTVIAQNGDSIDFGWSAKRNPKRLDAVKRLFATEDDVLVGSRSMKVEEAAAIFFRQISTRAAEAGLDLDAAVVTIPANSRGVARFRTKVSAGLSGIEVLALLNEPTAAAMAYARHIEDDQRVLVFDFGGGTLDVTILRSVEGVFVEEASKGVGRLGGIDIDRAFAETVKRRVPARSSIDASDLERAKVMLSTQETVTISLVGGGTLELNRIELETAIQPLLQQCAQPVLRCINDLGSPKIDHLLLVGGSSKIPAVQRHVSQLVRLDPTGSIDPMTAVAEGAALSAGILNGDIVDFDFFVATEHALGTIITDPLTERQNFSVLIPRNTKLPASATDGYTPVVDNQEAVTIKVIEGDPEHPVDHEDNVVLKEWDVDITPPRPVSEAGFTVTYSYDVDGILNVKVVDSQTEAVRLDEQLSFGVARSKADLVEIRKRIDGMPGGTAPSNGASAGPRLDDESMEVISRARSKIMPFLDDAEVATFESLIETLTESAPEDREAPRAALQKAIRGHAYLL